MRSRIREERRRIRGVERRIGGEGRRILGNERVIEKGLEGGEEDYSFPPLKD